MATDNLGATTTSAPVSVTVTGTGAVNVAAADNALNTWSRITEVEAY